MISGKRKFHRRPHTLIRWWIAVLLISSIEIAPQRPLLAEELAGQFLVATPEMRDPRFVQTVILMIHHNDEGAMGLVVNRPMARGPLADLLKGLGVESEPVAGEIILHYGGPVEPEKVFVLHSDDYTGKGTLAVGSGVAVTGALEIIQAIARGKGPRRSLFLLGYAGWAPGQIEAEIRAGDWFSIPADEKIIFDPDPTTKWDRAMERRKIKT